MRLIPRTPTADMEPSERKIFRLLKELRNHDEWVGLHSLRLDWHLNQIEGEIDFLLVGPPGIFVVEVKGGGIEFDGNLWTSRDRKGEIHRLRKPPMKQASDAMWSLKTKLCGQEFPSVNKIAKRARWGWIVIFPDCSFQVQSVEWNTNKVIDSTSILSLDGFTAGLRDAVSHHINHEPHHRDLDADEIEQIAQACRPIFDTVPSLKEELLHLDEVAMALTSEQYKVLDWSLDNPRIVCAGGAGTGKTLVALEVARRRRDSGQLVTFACRSKPLLDLLSRQPRIEGINFSEWSDLGDFPAADFLVVDEAQDVLGPTFEMSVSRGLKGGLLNGEWFVSIDPNHQSGLEKPFDFEFFEILKSYATLMRLNKNVRNTLTIIQQTQWATNADLGIEGTGSGPQVMWAISGDRLVEGDLVVAEIRRLLDEESTHPSEIAVLYLNPASKPEFSEDARRVLGVQLLDVSSAQHVSGVTFTSAAAFKGLERQAVLVVGARQLDQISNPLNHLYTAMSRARGYLWIATTDELGDLISRSAQKLES